MEVINDHEHLVNRAISAYFRTENPDGLIQPSASASYAVKFEGKEYIVLSNIDGVLAVYRVKNDGYLKRLKRWPKEIENA